MVQQRRALLVFFGLKSICPALRRYNFGAGFSEILCPVHEHWNICSTACPETCETKPIVCWQKCISGCECDTGLIRLNGKCVQKSECPCPDVNAERRACGPICDCDQYLQNSAICQNICFNLTPEAPMLCVCKDGYVRQSGTYQCITIAACTASMSVVG